MSSMNNMDLSNRRIRSFFEDNPCGYANSINPWVTRVRAKKIRKYVSGITLDVGIGPGQLAEQYLVRPIVACDFSIGMLKLAKARPKLKDSLFVVADVENLPFKKGLFDTIIASEVIYYLQCPEEFLEEAFRCLAPNGKLILIMGNSLLNPLFKLATFLRLRPEDPFSLKTPSVKNILQLIHGTVWRGHLRIIYQSTALDFCPVSCMVVSKTHCEPVWIKNSMGTC